jgi:NADPH:quinone reductase
MKAIRAHQWCGPRDLSLDDVEQPQPDSRQILIRVNVAGLNFPDLLIITGKYQYKPALPFSPGFEIAGTVEKIGEGVNRFTVGDRVVAQVSVGGFAEYAIAEESNTHPIPGSMSDDEAAAFPLVYQTSYFGLAYRGGLQKVHCF